MTLEEFRTKLYEGTVDLSTANVARGLIGHIVKIYDDEVDAAVHFLLAANELLEGNGLSIIDAVGELDGILATGANTDGDTDGHTDDCETTEEEGFIHDEG